MAAAVGLLPSGHARAGYYWVAAVRVHAERMGLLVHTEESPLRLGDTYQGCERRSSSLGGDRDRGVR